MSTLDALSTLSGSPGAAATSARDRLGQKDFIQLMLAQVRNQDPLKPLDGAEFIGQLAQFSTVTGIEDMGTSLRSLVESLRSERLLAGATLIGRDVLVASDRTMLGETGEVRGSLEVPDGAQRVQVTVRDASGQVVRQLAVDPAAGLADFRWDGLTASGGRAPPGAYRFEAIATGADRNVSLPLFLGDRVRSVTLDAAGRQFVLDTTHHGSVRLADVRRIG